MQVKVNNNITNKTLTQMNVMGHEQVVFCSDQDTGLKAIIAIHNTTLGPALGGTRMWDYINEELALHDVLRLSRGMTLKASISGLDLGGGKAVIIGDPNTHKTESLMRKFGEYVDSLGGKYITSKDVGVNTKDMEYIRSVTEHVTGIPEEMGGSGDPSPVTAYGVYMGMKAAAKFRWGGDGLAGKKILVQGVGYVGESLVKHLSSEGASIYISDIDDEKTHRVSKDFGAEIVEEGSIYNLDVDIYAPCALGATLNTETIDRLNCEVIAGAANNQLEDEHVHAEQIKNKGILYAPDFLINAGGLINVYSEIKGYDRNMALKKTQNIFDTTLEIFLKSENEQITTHQAALDLANQRIFKSHC